MQGKSAAFPATVLVGFGIITCFITSWKEGKLRISVDGKTQSHTLRKGGFFIFFPGQEHEYRASRKIPWHYTWLGFEGSLAPAALAAANVSWGQSCFNGDYSPELALLFVRIIEELGSRRLSSSLASDGLLRVLLSRLATIRSIKAVGDRARPARHNYAVQARCFIEEHFERPIKVADVARFIGLDREYLSSLFKAETGTTMKKLLTELRMEKASHLLSEGSLSVAQVATTLGYREYAVFERAYKKARGVSPRYRAKLL
ncbi:AraC family ligand binding domain-containing protein [Treponema sp.]